MPPGRANYEKAGVWGRGAAFLTDETTGRQTCSWRQAQPNYQKAARATNDSSGTGVPVVRYLG